jgi:hypothetical protein
VTLVTTDVSEIIPLTSSGWKELASVLQLLVNANLVPSSLILSTLMIYAIRSPKRRSLQEPHGVTSQKVVLFMFLYGFQDIRLNIN